MPVCYQLIFQFSIALFDRFFVKYNKKKKYWYILAPLTGLNCVKPIFFFFNRGVRDFSRQNWIPYAKIHVFLKKNELGFSCEMQI